MSPLMILAPEGSRK